jgi:hypothetical protein
MEHDEHARADHRETHEDDGRAFEKLAHFQLRVPAADTSDSLRERA